MLPLSPLKETEAVSFVVAGNEKRGPGDNFIIEQLKRVKVPVFLVVNKIDTQKRGAFRSYRVLSRCISICRGYSYFCKG